MALNLKPLGSRVVIDPIEQEDITAAALCSPKRLKRNPNRVTFWQLALATVMKMASVLPWT